SEVFFLTNDDMVKHTSGNSSAISDIFISSVANSRYDSDFVWRINGLKVFFNSQIPGRIMSKVNHHFEVFELKNVHTSWGLCHTRNKSLKRHTDVLCFESVKVTG